jgi:ssDNA-binding replication factor A large subunit
LEGGAKERMMGVEQETKITSGRRGEDWDGGEKEGKVRNFRELDRSADKLKFSLGWVKGEKVRRHPVGDVREKRAEIAGCRFEGFRRRRERNVQLSVVSIEVVIVRARE